LPFFFIVLQIYRFTQSLYRPLEIHFSFTLADKSLFLRSFILHVGLVMGFMADIQILRLYLWWYNNGNITPKFL